MLLKAYELLVLLIIVSTFGVLLGSYIAKIYIAANRNSCYFYLCNTNGTLEHCMGLRLWNLTDFKDCNVLEEKCRHVSYMKQYNLKCKWTENACYCWPYDKSVSYTHLTLPTTERV